MADISKMENGRDIKESNQIQIGARLKRTPPLSAKSGSDVLEMIQTPARKGQKRGAEDNLHTMSIDMFDSLMDRFNSLSNEIKSSEINVEKKIDEKFRDLQGFIENTNKKLEDLEVKVEENDKRLDQNTKAINLLNQKELQNKMDIIGAKWPKRIEREKIKEEVLKLMRKYNINLDAKEIKSAYVRTNSSTDMQIMVVEFADFETKLKVMKDKRASTIRDGIFFDSSLTPLNGKLMSSARKIAKDKKFKAYINNNRINVKKSDGKVKWIECEADLENIKSWTPNDDSKLQNNSNDQENEPSATSQQHPSA